MSLNFFSDIGDESIWTDAELKAALKLSEQAYMNNTKQVQYFSQMVLYNSKSEIKETIQALRTELSRRLTGKSGRTKKVLITTPCKGF